MLAEHLHKSLNEVMQETTERQYRQLWLPRLYDLKKLIPPPKPRDPNKDGPPIVTKEMIAEVNKQQILMRLKSVKKKRNG